jgi:hypothetical protein
MFAFGAGSMLAALALPRCWTGVPDRPVMVGRRRAHGADAPGLAGEVAALGLDWPVLLGAWLLVGLGYSAVLTPSGRLLRRSAHAEDRPALFAAQFALSHACWLVTYPLSGWLMTQFGRSRARGCWRRWPGAGALSRTAPLAEGGSRDPRAHPRQPAARPPASQGRAAPRASLRRGRPASPLGVPALIRPSASSRR